MSAPQAGLEERFRTQVVERGGLGPGDRIVVALSGGLDSVVLLHLLRFGSPPPGVEVHAAHFDHAMRPSSADDARWVAGMCRAWGVRLHETRAAAAPTSEAAARDARYSFLERVRRDVGGKLVLTAHQADDQAETVLFRMLRGTGTAGLAGIPARREPALWRPLLGFWRAELEAYAARVRLCWREDPTNEQLRYARNALRNDILPRIERLVAPGARRALVRLADQAREDEAAWRGALPQLMEPLRTTAGARSVSCDRDALLRLQPEVRARVLRALAADVGARLDAAGTRLAADFAASASSGRRLDLGSGWTLGRELDRLVLSAAATIPPDQPLRIPDPGPGAGDALLAGERIPVVWGGEGAAPTRSAQTFDADLLRFPLLVRAREAGDRIRLPGGTKKVKKLLLEKRIPSPLRRRTPMVVDAEGNVLWIPGVARAETAPGGRGGGPSGALRIEIG